MTRILTDYADFNVPFATGRGNKGKVKNTALKWPAFLQQFTKPSRSAETHKQFFKLNAEEQLVLKNMDGFWLGGTSTDGHRRRTSILERSILTMDIEGDDFTPAMLGEMLVGYSPISDYEWAIHSSRKHTDEKPRVRLIVPITRPVLSEEYEPVARLVAAKLDPTMDAFDPVSFRFAQMMFKPTASKDAPYVFHHNRGDMIDPDVILATWNKDYATLPFSEKHQKARKTKEKAEDPREKEGIVGAFCRAYGMEETIAEFLSDLYVHPSDEGSSVRYTYAGGTTAGGAIVYDDLWLYSYHTHDPAAERLVNAFDLVRIHLYGDLDDDVKEGTKPGSYPSYRKMIERFSEDPRVAVEYDPASKGDFEDLGPDDDRPSAASGSRNEQAEAIFDEIPDDDPSTKPPPKKEKITRLDWMNKRHAIVQNAGATPRVMTFNKDGTFGLSDWAGFNMLYKNKPVPKAGAKNEEETRAEWWLRQPERRTYPGGIVFLPGVDTEPEAYNLFRGWSCRRDPDHSKCALILRHIEEVIAAGDPERAEYIFNWCAHLVQKPAEKPEVAIGLNGKKGVGKDTLAVALSKIMKSHYVVVNKMDHLTGRFNAHETQALLIHCPDAVWGGDRGAVGALNNLITQPDTMIDRKHQDQFNVRSFCRLFITSNEEWIIPASPDERRWAVFDVSDVHMQDPAWFEPLWHEIEGDTPGGIGPGIPAFFDWLMKRDISEFNPRRFPVTEGLDRQKVLTFKGVDQFIYDLLIEGEPVERPEAFNDDEWETSPSEVSKDGLFEAYRNWHKDRRFAGEIKSMDALCRRIIQLIPSAETTRPRVPAGQQRVRKFKFPPLPICRAEFSQNMNTRVTWPDDGSNAGEELI